MLLYRLNAAAGPSTLGLALKASRAPLRMRTHTLPLGALAPVRWASSSPSPSSTSSLDENSPATITKWSNRSILRSTIAARPRLTAQEWPWRPVNPPRNAWMVEEERVLFARPATTNPKIFWAMAILYGSAVAIFLILPSPDEARTAGRGGEDEGTIIGIPTGMFMSYLAGGTITMFTIMAAAGALFPSRMITRLSLVRSHPPGVHVSKATECLRLQHMGHGMMWGNLALPRELPVKDVKVNILMGNPTTAGGERSRIPWLGLKVRSPGSNSKLAFDGYGYRLDFRQTPALEAEKGEVVLSLARLEDVFGPLTWEGDEPGLVGKK